MKIWKKWSKTAAMLMVASACMFTGMSTTAFANVDEAAVAEAEQQADTDRTDGSTAGGKTTRDRNKAGSGRGKGQAIFCSGKWGGAGPDHGWFQ